MKYAKLALPIVLSASLALVSTNALAEPASDDDGAMVQNVDGEAEPFDYEKLYLIAADCTVALEQLEDAGASTGSSAYDWLVVLSSLGQKLERDASLEYLFRETEISALMEVEPAETSAWIDQTAAACALMLPAEQTPETAGGAVSQVSS